MQIRRYASSEEIIDRDNEVERVKELLLGADKSQVHIVFANSGYGKTSFTIKLTQEFSYTDWDAVRVETTPINENSNTPEGEYLDSIFDTLRKYFEKKGHLDLLFDNYLSSGNNKMINKLALDNVIDTISSANSLRKVPRHILAIQAKKWLKTGVYNPYEVIYCDTPAARSVKAEYVRFLFERARILLILENAQNIDNMSYKFLLDWIRDTKDNKHGFLLEYTVSGKKSERSLNNFRQLISRLGVPVFDLELEKISSDYIAEIIDTQLVDKPSDIHFTIKVQQHYNECSEGNLWELLDFARTYEDSQSNDENPSPTLTVLNKLSSEAKYLVSIIVYHDGLIDQSLLHYIWLNCFSNKTEDALLGICDELEHACIVKFREDKTNTQVYIAHASIIDVWQDARIDFSAIDKETYTRLLAFYQDCYHEKTRAAGKQFAWQMLIQLYASHKPDEISNLLGDFKTNVIKHISRENTWNYLNALIQCTQKNITEFEDVYFKILQICLSASLYSEGYSCIQLMEQQLNIESNDRLLLNKLLYLSILDRHNDVIAIYRQVINTTEKKGKTWINLKLLVLNSFTALDEKQACISIHHELIKMPGLRKSAEYAIFLRLTNIYLKPARAINNARKSVKYFRKQGNTIQEGKSLITYSKLLSSVGKHKKAIELIERAKDLLSVQNEGMSCVYNNLACYLLLTGEHGRDVWYYLDMAEMYSVSTYDKLSVTLNKLAWCYENRTFSRIDSLESNALDLIKLEPSQLMHCTTYYNLQLVMRAAGNKKKAEKYYDRAVALKEKSSCIKARIDGVTRNTYYLKPRIQKPYHICYLSFWVFDVP